MKNLWLLGLFVLFGTKSWASEDSLYDFVWLDPDKKVYVLQNKLFQKVHTFYADVGYLTNYTSKFQDTSGFQGKIGYYFTEEWGIEAFMNYYNNSDNDDVKNVQLINNQRPFIRRLTSSTGLLAIWSPFYGKINTFNRIFYFDWSFGAGLAKISAEDNLVTSLQNATGSTVPEKFDQESYTGAIVKTNVKFYFKERYHVGLEYMNSYYQAPSPKSPKTDKLRTNTDVVLSVGFSI